MGFSKYDQSIFRVVLLYASPSHPGAPGEIFLSSSPIPRLFGQVSPAIPKAYSSYMAQRTPVSESELKYPESEGVEPRDRISPETGWLINKSLPTFGSHDGGKAHHNGQKEPTLKSQQQRM